MGKWKNEEGAGLRNLIFCGKERGGGVGATLHPYIYNMFYMTLGY
tara:strand:- start:118 stop:252 length:135 start_codon:yes stop_codon:yes gene_type:complete